MKRAAKKLGLAVYWLALPFWLIYFRLSERTRVLLVCGDKVLVITPWLGDSRWSMPGGGLHKGEDPAHGAVRELREEVGIQLAPEQLKLTGFEVHHRHGYKYPYYQFVAQLPNEQSIKRQRHEIAEAVWIDYRELNTSNARADLLRALHTWRPL